ncbi:MAG: DoxX family protein [Myxococcaceae bacterium]
MRMQDVVRFFTHPPTSGPKATLAIRLLAGGVFLSEGILKFVYVNQGVGRFTKLGMPMPGLLAPAIALLEIGGGLLLISGLATRFICVPFLIEMVVAVLSTKVGLYFGTSPLAKPPAPPVVGWWAVLHESRADYAQLLSCAFLLAAGPGPWSLDALLAARAKRRSTAEGPSGAVVAARS